MTVSGSRTFISTLFVRTGLGLNPLLLFMLLPNLISVLSFFQHDLIHHKLHRLDLFIVFIISVSSSSICLFVTQSSKISPALTLNFSSSATCGL